MTRISVGFTTTGKAILIAGKPQRNEDIEKDFRAFSAREIFDALLAVEYLSLSELRRGVPDFDWAAAIHEVYLYLRNKLGEEAIVLWKVSLSIDSAFAARDYGKALVHPHFRWL